MPKLIDYYFTIISDIDRPKYTGLFMSICVLFISIFNKLSENFFVA